MKKKRAEDRFLVVMGSILIALTLAVPIVYQTGISVYKGNPFKETKDMERKATVEGYETPEEVVEYVVYQIHQGDLDLALRGCAIQEVAECFSLEGYAEVLDEFPYTQTLAPAEYDDKAYIEINQARMTAVYSDMLEQCMSVFGDGYDLEVLRIRTDIPEDADGFYYQDIRDISAVSGARDACNVVVDMRVDGVERQMVLTVARYRKYWKVLQFSAYNNYQYTEPQISEYAEETGEQLLPLEWEDMTEQVLPCNYQIVSSRSEKNIETLVRKLYVYIQRGEMWKALAYYDFYEPRLELCPDSIFFDKQSRAAKELQEIYYRMLLHDKDQMSWIKQNVRSEAVNLMELLDASLMIYSDLDKVEVTELGDGKARCILYYQYDKVLFDSTILLNYNNGWKITRIIKTGWKEVDGQWYYLDSDGNIQTGWQEIDEKWYYLGTDGVMWTGWHNIDGNQYYLGDDGIMRKGWLEMSGHWYHMGVKGAMQTGWHASGDVWYYFDKKTGEMATDTYIDGYYVNADGVWIPESQEGFHERKITR